MNLKKTSAAILTALFVLFSIESCSPKKEAPADLVLKNGVIYTVDGARSLAQALAVKDGRFLYIGTNKGVSRFVGKGTRVVDLGGKLVLPGFIDSHCHPSSATQQFGSAPLTGLRSLPEYQKAIREFRAGHPGIKVVRGRGWSNTVFGKSGPTREMLDEAVKDIPAAMSSEDGHSVWVNTKTLEAAGLTRKTHDPLGGVIERDPKSGEPAGTLRESAAGLVRSVIPDFSLEEFVSGLEEYQTMALAFGITTAHEAELDLAGDNALPAYEILERDSRLRMRFRASLYVDPRLDSSQVSGLAAEREKHKSPLYQTNGAKIFIDGVVEGGTAFLKEPYVHKPGFRGEPLWKMEDLVAACKALDRENFQLHFHAIGDAAVAESLDGIAGAVAANGPRDRRSLITHLQLVLPADIRRFKDLGVVAVPQPFWFMKDDYYTNIQVPYLGQKRADEEYPMESFFNAGVPVASSSDYPVTIPCDPLRAIQIGITRSRPGFSGPDEILWPAERATLEQMIASFTIFGAYANFLEKETGSIESGKSADLIVLDRNLFETPADKIADAKVVLTLFAGKIAYEKRFPQ
jgi:predicted amidohydrolase YtcJ